MSMSMLDCVVRSLHTAGFSEPCCVVELDGVQESRLPMGQIKRQSRVRVKFWPEPTEKVLSFHAEGEKDPYYPLSELSRLLELIDTPNGPVRGRGTACAVKDGAAVVIVTYTEWLREAETPRPRMGAVTLRISPESRDDD